MVVAVAVCLPGTGTPILALPLLARLHLPGKGQPSCVDLTREMLAEVLEWFPGRNFTLVGDGAYASKGLLGALDPRVTFVALLAWGGVALAYQLAGRREGDPELLVLRHVPAGAQAQLQAPAGDLVHRHRLVALVGRSPSFGISLTHV